MSAKKRNYAAPFGGLHIEELQIVSTLFVNSIGLIVDELAPSDAKVRAERLREIRKIITQGLKNADVSGAPMQHEARAMGATLQAITGVLDVLIAETGM